MSSWLNRERREQLEGRWRMKFPEAQDSIERGEVEDTYDMWVILVSGTTKLFSLSFFFYSGKLVQGLE